MKALPITRRKFLEYCLATGVASGSLVSCTGAKANLSAEDKTVLRGMRIADAHAHPHQFFESSRHDKTTPTVETIAQVGMAACSFAAVGDRVKYGDIWGRPFDNTMDQLRFVRALEIDKKVRVIRRSSDIQNPHEPNILPGAVMSIEGGDALEGTIANLDKFHAVGVRMMTVMHAHNNEIGFHQRSEEDGPLTPFGIRVIERMNELGMVVDVAHAKTQTLKGIAEITAAPLVDSHTNPMAFGYRHSMPTRLRYWHEMEMVAKTGGVICTWPVAYTAGKYGYARLTLQHWAEEIVEMKKRLGMAHIGIGTDGGGGLRRVVNGWDSILSLPGLINAMRMAGLSQDDIAAYLGGNFLRVLNQSLG